VEARYRVLGRPGQVSDEEHLLTGTRAAVLVPIFEEDGEARVVLTRRAAHLRTHPGEVSFPGGRLDAGEAPEEGALREAAEEIALDPGSVEVVGRLTPLSTFSSGAAITPVVGVISSRPRLLANPSEVERVFDVALAKLTAVDVFREERWVALGTSSPVWFFELDEDTVCGATARILVELLRLALEV
jgi:8-oxo-dGTP pyrophosphatase MutT (NUDIX family)